MRLCKQGITLGIIMTTLLAGCATRYRTEVYTVSDRPPAPASSYRVELDDEQSRDLEAKRLASQIEARMNRAGFRRVADLATKAEVIVGFELFDDGPAGREPRSSAGVATSRGTTVGSSQSTVGGIPVPLTRRTTVYQHDEHGVSTGGSVTELDRMQRRYRLALSFVDATGPSHKITVSMTTTYVDLQELAPCLVEAAFQEFPLGDRQRRDVVLTPKLCRAG